MPEKVFKLKQASAVLGVSPKDLQNLVQLKVIRPLNRESVHWFDSRLLLQAKVAFYLKESLGASSEVLGRLTEVLAQSIANLDPKKEESISLHSRPMGGRQQIEIKIPLGSLARELETQFPLAQSKPDLPRGRRRRTWKAEMLSAFELAAQQMGDVSNEEIQAVIAEQRRAKKPLPEVTVRGHSARKTA